MDDNSVANVREELDAYGEHLPVYIEDFHGTRYEVLDIRSQTTSAGVIVIIAGHYAE